MLGVLFSVVVVVLELKMLFLILLDVLRELSAMSSRTVAIIILCTSRTLIL